MPEEIAPVIELAPALTPTPTPEPLASPVPTPPVAEQTTPAGTEQPGIPPPAAVPPPATPSVPDVRDQYIERLEGQQARLEGQEELRILQDEVAAYAARLEEQEGFTPEQAQKIARQQGARAYQDFNAQRAQERKLSDAFAIGQHYGVDPQQLINMPNRATMLQAAMLATTLTKVQSRMSALEAENTALKQKLVPAQSFAAPGVSPTPAPGSYLEKLKSGGPLPSAAEIDKFTAQYLTGS